MEIAMIGLGKMGANMVTRLLRGGHRVVVYDLNEDAIRNAEGEGAEGARTLEEVVEKLEGPRAVWVMVPAGKPTEETITSLSIVPAATAAAAILSAVLMVASLLSGMDPAN